MIGRNKFTKSICIFSYYLVLKQTLHFQFWNFVRFKFSFFSFSNLNFVERFRVTASLYISFCLSFSSLTFSYACLYFFYLSFCSLTFSSASLYFFCLSFCSLTFSFASLNFFCLSFCSLTFSFASLYFFYLGLSYTVVTTTLLFFSLFGVCLIHFQLNFFTK